MDAQHVRLAAIEAEAADAEARILELQMTLEQQSEARRASSLAAQQEAEIAAAAAEEAALSLRATDGSDAGSERGDAALRRLVAERDALAACLDEVRSRPFRPLAEGGAARVPLMLMHTAPGLRPQRIPTEANTAQRAVRD